MFVAAPDAGPIIAISLVLIVGLILAFFVASWVRRWYNAPTNLPKTGFTLADLREMHRTGQMTTEEFERAKAKLVDAAKASIEKPAPTEKPRGSPPTDLR